MSRPIILCFCYAFLLCTTSVYSLDYYWIGGSGEWSDLSHWATTSGGTLTHNKLPTADDDVYFDANSFDGPGQVVEIDAANVFCRSMSWEGATGQPLLNGDPAGILNIHGSLELIAAMTVDFGGSLHFLSRSPDQSINLAGHSLTNVLYFEGAGGEWTLAGPLSTSGRVELANGSLATAGYAVAAAGLKVAVSEQGGLLLGNSEVKIETGGKASVAINTLNLTMETAQAEFELSGSRAEFILSGDAAARFKTLRFTSEEGDATLRGSVDLVHQFGEVSFAGNANLSGMFDIGRLTLAAGSNNILQSEMTYNITELNAAGECLAPIQLFSSSSGAAATITSDSEELLVEYVSLKDIHAAGDAVFTASNSADLGNNAGWQIEAGNDNNLYWVGGTGRWSDPAHWSYSSGGPGGACIPTGADNVFFDANSFDGQAGIVTIDVQNAFCRDMSWAGATGSPILMGDMDRNLRIYGSLQFIEDMELQFEGDVHFESPRLDNTIASAGQLFRQDILFDGYQGGWKLADSLAVANFIYFEQGSLETTGQPFTCARFLSGNARPRLLSLDNSHIMLRFLDVGFSTWELNLNSLEFYAGSSLIEFLNHGHITHKGDGRANYFDVTFRESGFLDAGQNEGMSIHDLLFEGPGTIFHSWTINRLELTPGYEYQLDVDNVQDIGTLVAEGACDAYISIRSVIDDVPAPIRSDQANTGAYLILKDIDARSGNFTANQSIDLGNNQGWTFDRLGGRTLYWVGGAGDWEDRAHWSVSSGGPGGECIPTPADDVVFDANSFDAAGQTVFGWQVVDHFCRNMSWRTAANEPVFDISRLQVFGSLELQEEMTAMINELQLRGEETGQTLLSAGQRFNSVVVEGSGSWRLEDPLVYANRLHMLNGQLETNGQPLTCGQFTAARVETPKVLSLDTSLFVVDGPGDRSFSWEVLEADFRLEAGQSTIELTHPTSSMRNRIPLEFGRVIFTASSDKSRLASSGDACSYDYVRFDKDAVITGVNAFDTLVFSEGKAYQLEAGVTQTIVDHFQLIGNNCSPIKLSSTKPGQQSIVYMQQGQVNGDFIQMRDQEATGAATFYAGIHSTDIGNSNTGWIFESAQSFVDVGFLGTDVVLCRDQAVTLDADNNSGNEQYRWHDGSTGPTFTTNQPGTYWVEVSFGVDCATRDSVVLLPPEIFQAQLTNDTTLCGGESLLLDASLDIAGVIFNWQDGSTLPTFEVSEPGTYDVKMELGGCADSTSTTVDYIYPPAVQLGADTTLCQQASLQLTAESQAATGYLWQDSVTTSPDFTVTEPGTYWVALLVDRCPSRDSIVVDYYEAINPDLGADTVLCEQESLTLEWPQENARYAWPDGSNLESFTIDSPGEYWVDVTLNNCTERDSIRVNYKPLPAIDLGEDFILCEGETATLDGASDNGADSYLWQDSTTNAGLFVDQSGDYWLEASLNGCTRRDSITVTYIIIPDTELGGDTTLCEGQVLNADISLPQASYTWQDGSSSPRYSIREAGIYWGQVQVERCTDRDSIFVTYNPLPEIEIGSDTVICEGDVFAMDVISNGESFSWFDGSTAARYQVQMPGLHWAEAVLNGCTNRDTAVVEFQTRQSIDLGADTTICHDQQYRLDPGVRGDSYRWQDGSGDATYLVDAQGVYSVEIIDGQCVLSDTVVVQERECTYFTYFIPNVFSPNGDGINDRLEVNFPPEMQILNFEISVFDRWGTLLYQSADPQNAWDGQYRSQQLPTGVYVYSIDVEYIDDRKQDREVITGDVMLTQ